MAVDVCPTVSLCRRPRWLTALAIGVVAATVAAAFVVRAIERTVATQLPDVPAPSMSSVLGDQTPVAVTITAYWQKADIVVPSHAVRSDVSLWRQMNVDDWDKLANPLREEALSAMWNRYRHIVGNPREWDRMDAHDWDWIPQPVRAMAYIQMMKHWSGYYQVGVQFGLPRGTVTSTLNAIVMAESWFEHRATHTNTGGDRDIGLGGFSEYCRRTLERLASNGTIEFAINPSDYFDPWRATRMVAVWFDLMLREANGQLDLAVRAYHRGSPLAHRGEGMTYLAHVDRLRRRYIRNEDSAPAWHFMYVRAADEEHARAASAVTSEAPSHARTRSAGYKGLRHER